MNKKILLIKIIASGLNSELFSSGQDSGGTIDLNTSPPAPPAAAAPPAPPAVASPVPPSALGTNFSSPAVKEMQQSIKNFATAVASYSSTKDSNLGTSGRKPFNDFITEQYLANSNIKGVEWSKDPTKISQEQKTPTATKPTELEFIINGFERIGGPKSEFAIDGIWGFRTNNALLNIYAFAYALVKLSKDFKTTLNAPFTEKDLGDLKSNIPDSAEFKTFSQKTGLKIQSAKALTPIINKLTTFYNAYVEQIAKNPSLIQYIEGAPLININTNNKPKLTPKTPKEQQIFQNANKIYISENPKNYLVLSDKSDQPTIIDNIQLASLTSISGIKEILKKLNYSPNEITNEIISKCIKDILIYVQNILAYNNYEQPLPEGRGFAKSSF